MQHKSYIHAHGGQICTLQVFLLLSAPLLHLLCIFTKHKFNDKIIKNFMTTTAQVASPWNQHSLKKENLHGLEQLTRRISEGKNAQMGFQNKRIWADLGTPTLIILLGLMSGYTGRWLTELPKILGVPASSVLCTRLPPSEILGARSPPPMRLTYLWCFWEETKNKNGDFLRGTFSFTPASSILSKNSCLDWL